MGGIPAGNDFIRVAVKYHETPPTPSRGGGRAVQQRAVNEESAINPVPPMYHSGEEGTGPNRRWHMGKAGGHRCLAEQPCVGRPHGRAWCQLRRAMKPDGAGHQRAPEHGGKQRCGAAMCRRACRDRRHYTVAGSGNFSVFEEISLTMYFRQTNKASFKAIFLSCKTIPENMLHFRIKLLQTKSISGGTSFW